MFSRAAGSEGEYVKVFISPVFSEKTLEGRKISKEIKISRK